VLLLYISVSPVHCAKIVGVTSSDGFLICVLLFVLYMVRYDGALCFRVVHPSVRACVRLGAEALLVGLPSSCS